MKLSQDTININDTNILIRSNLLDFLVWKDKKTGKLNA